MFFYMFGFYTAWMLGIAALAYQKLKGFDDYATHFVGRKDYGIIVMMLTMFASWISGNTITNVPNASSALGYTSFYITAAYCQCYLGWSWVAPRVRRLNGVLLLSSRRHSLLVLAGPNADELRNSMLSSPEFGPPVELLETA